LLICSEGSVPAGIPAHTHAFLQVRGKPAESSISQDDKKLRTPTHRYCGRSFEIDLYQIWQIIKLLNENLNSELIQEDELRLNFFTKEGF
jgi:hypothetical protein